MSLISTYIDLNQGILFVKSPRCKTELQIPLKLESYFGETEEIGLHGHRFSSRFLVSVLCASYIHLRGPTVFRLWKI